MERSKVGRVSQEKRALIFTIRGLMSDYLSETGFYWRPLGGNNIDQISGHCYQYTDISLVNGKKNISSIIVDLGKFDNHQALGIKNSIAALPDIRELLTNKRVNLQAIFFTHSHPDHLNGVVHYIKAGYILPELYGGKYTKLILDQLCDEFCIPTNNRPKFNIINIGDIIKLGSLTLEILPASHTCFDSLGFIIQSNSDVCVYHTGDMKTDNSTCFRKPTNLKRLNKLAKKIDYVVADFYGAADDGFATKEIDTYKEIVRLIRQCHKEKIFVSVYPTHAEMYLIAFLAALKNKKDVVFYGNKDFYSYLELIKKYGIDFEKLAKNRINVYVGRPQNIKKGFVVVGTFNDIHNYFAESPDNSFGIITSGTFFNPLRGQFNARGIKFADVDKHPFLQSVGHGFWGDLEKLNRTLSSPTFIPTHCPQYITDYCRDLAKISKIKLASPTPQNNHIYKLEKKHFKEISTQPAVWLVASSHGESICFSEMWQKPTSGTGFLKRTLSKRRCQAKFREMCHKRKTR
ncbi:MAG: hypothetical protein E7019_05155 [Alphaproteobacteria bacterium]|nr:hypothetical protein [Alphaproteobacteria bacterium]